jgi:hypothetical protein
MPAEMNQEYVRHDYMVFISHAGSDTWVANKLAQSIEEKGATTFLDEAHIAIGEDFEDRILDALDQSKELIVYFTPWSLTRPYVWTEIGAAWGKRIPIVGVLHGLTPEELNSKAGIPNLIKRRNLIDINKFDNYLMQLGARLGK